LRRESFTLISALLTSASGSANVTLLRESHALALHSGVVARSLQAQGTLVALPLTLTHDTGEVGLVAGAIAGAGGGCGVARVRQRHSTRGLTGSGPTRGGRARGGHDCEELAPPRTRT